MANPQRPLNQTIVVMSHDNSAEHCLTNDRHPLGSQDSSSRRLTEERNRF